jgi:hypothetical protein
MIRPPMLQEIDGEYTLVEQGRPLHIWFRRCVGCAAVVLVWVCAGVIVLVWGW